MTEEGQDIELVPPSEHRVLRRAWALSSVVCRCFVEGFEDPIEAAILHSRLLRWIDAMELRREFEPAELATVETDLGSLNRQTQVNGTWRSEGLAVLAWSLGAVSLPRHDQMVDPMAAANSIHFLSDDAKDAAKLLRLRPGEDLDAFSWIQLCLHWRIRDFSIHRQSRDSRREVVTAWSDSLGIDGVPLVENDLVIDGVPISQAPEDRFRQCQSIAMERHQAINWLRGWHEIYSEVDTST